MRDRYLIVRKPFKAGIKKVKHGDVVDTRGWRNTRALLESGYLKRPSGQLENKKVEEFVGDDKEDKKEKSKSSYSA